jgi:hypothetical protein
MIPASELRLGNLVNYTYKNVVKQGRVTSITSRRIVIDHGAVVKANSENLQPIPITLESLNKYGFQVFSYLIIYRIIEDERFYLYCPSDPQEPGAGYYYANSILAISNESKPLKYISNTSKPLKYIHELQNAFFMLTNHEL